MAIKLYTINWVAVAPSKPNKGGRKAIVASDSDKAEQEVEKIARATCRGYDIITSVYREEEIR